MSNLVEEIFTMIEGRGGDAIILQPKKEGSNGAPQFHLANAIIQRIPTIGGWKWVLRTLMYRGGGFVSAGSGIYGDHVDDVVKAAEREFGVKSDVREWVSVSYIDPDFPPNLLPGV